MVDLMELLTKCNFQMGMTKVAFGKLGRPLQNMLKVSNRIAEELEHCEG